MQNRTKGIILIMLSALFFALMAATVKSLNSIPVAQKIFFRNFIGLLIASYIVVKRKESFKGNNKKFLVLRSLFGLLGVAAYFYSLSRLSLADAVILNKMSPFFVLILSAIFLNERIGKSQAISLILALTGATLVIKPQFNLKILPALIGLSSSLFAGAAYTTIRHLRHSDSPQTIIFYFTLFSTVTMIPFMILGQFAIPSFYEFTRLLLLGAFATTAQFLMTYAYKYAPAGELSIYTYINIVFSTIIGLIIWHEIPDILTVLGGALIIAGGFTNYYSNKL